MKIDLVVSASPLAVLFSQDGTTSMPLSNPEESISLRRDILFVDMCTCEPVDDASGAQIAPYEGMVDLKSCGSTDTQ